jgi:hypothetical protein
MIAKSRGLLLAIIALVAVAGVLLYGRCRDRPAEVPGTSSSAEAGSTDRAGAGGEAPSPGQPFHLRGAATAGPGTVQGYVIDAASGDPVPYVDVIFRQGGAETTANSGDAGSYLLELPPGDYVVRALGDRVVALPQPALRVAGGPSPVRYDVRVQQLATVRGQVVDHRGNGVAGATVSLMPEDAGQAQLVQMGDILGTATSDAGGAFEIDAPAGDNVAIEAESAGLRGRAVVPALAPGGEGAVVIRLEQGASLTGIVRAPSNAPVAGATVHIAVRAEGMDQRHQLTTGADGRFAIDPVLAGTAVLEALADGYAQSVPTSETLAPGAESRVELRLQKPLVLAGQVIDGDGKPVEGVRVRTGRAGTRMKAFQTYTDADGGFRFDAVDRGPYWVSGYKQGYAIATREGVTMPVDDLTLRLAGFGGVRGRVVDADREPLGDFTVRIDRFRPVGVGAPKPGGSGTRLSPGDGRFELTPLEPGTYDLVVTAPGLAPASLYDVEVPAEDWAEVEVTMGRGGRIEGRITSARTGRPLAMARVAVAPGGDVFAFTERDGRFAIDDVGPGRRSLVITHPGHLALTVGGVEVAAGATRTVEVGLTPTGAGNNNAAEVSGIGVVLERRGDAVRIREVVDDGPAAGAGVKVGDVLVTIDGAAVAGLRAEDAADRLRGTAGTTVVIEIARGSQNRRFELERARFRAPDRDRGLVAMLGPAGLR